MRRTPVPLILSLGSNLGDRRRYLRAAVSLLSRFVAISRISSIYRSDPVDSPEGSPEYLNLVVAGSTALTPLSCLAACQEIEESLGRRRRRRNEPRVLDIDIVLFGSRMIRSAPLTVPHRRFRDRNFVLVPIRELRLSWIDPVTGKRLSDLRGEGSVGRVGPLY